MYKSKWDNFKKNSLVYWKELDI